MPPGAAPMAMGTEAPTPIRSAREKLITTKGMARLTAAKAVDPKNWPTKTPSIIPYRAEASMLTAPGRAARKKSLTGGVRAKSASECMETSPFIVPMDQRAADGPSGEGPVSD